MQAEPAAQPTPAAAPPVRPRRTRRRWWLGGGAMLLVAVAVTVLVVRASGPRVFTHYPDDCALLTMATVKAYTHDDTCDVGDFRMGAYRLIQRSCSWAPKLDAARPKSAFEVELTLVRADNDVDSSTAEYNDQLKTDVTQEPSGFLDQHQVAGIGERAYFAYSFNPEGTAAELIVQLGNAKIVAYYYGYPVDASQLAFSSQQGERAVTAAVTDVINQLS